MSTVLLIYDDWGVRTLVTLALGIEGTTVWSASDGREALKILTHERVDLVILDLETIGLDGTLMFQEARREGFEGPILALSAFGTELAALELAAEVTLSKPLDLDELIVTTRNLLGAGDRAGS